MEDQYNLTHKNIPKSPRTMLPGLESIEKVFVKKYNKKTKADKAKVATASKADETHVPRKHASMGSSD
jgi:hypothetical protein